MGREVNLLGISPKAGSERFLLLAGLTMAEIVSSNSIASGHPLTINLDNISTII